MEPIRDVLVVGAGPTGLTLAAELCRHGVDCRVIEELETPHPWSKAAAVQARTVELLDDMGLAEALLAQSKAVVAIAVHAGGRRIAQLPIEGIASRYPHVYGVSQRVTEEVLLGGLLQLGGAVERGVRLESFEEESECVRATLARSGGGPKEIVRARYIVGTDGAHSTVRKCLGLSFGGSSYEERLLQADLRATWPGRVADDEINAFLSEDGPLAMFPLFQDGRVRLVAMLMPGAPEPPESPPLETFQRLAAERGPKGIELSDPAWTVSFRIHCRSVERYRVGRAFLAGDACHIHSPLGGQGMNTGIQDAYNLAWKLGLVLRGRARPELLDAYQAERLPVAKQLLTTTDRMTRGMERAVGLRHPIALGLRDHLMSLVSRLGLVQLGVAQRLSQTGVAYRDSPIVGQDRPSILKTRIGAIAGGAEDPTLVDWAAFGDGPAPGERAPDANAGGRDTLDLIRGTRHVLFLFDGAAATEGGYRKLDAIALQVAARWGDLISVQIVVPAVQRPEVLRAERVLLDPDGAFHRGFGARSECLYLIRPDGYVAYRCQPADGAQLEAYLSRHYLPTAP
jgi:2-polyprenyl-6-methoxyphenol hydroxylase-like FAD-dependent oxidoreductase